MGEASGRSTLKGRGCKSANVDQLSAAYGRTPRLKESQIGNRIDPDSENTRIVKRGWASAKGRAGVLLRGQPLDLECETRWLPRPGGRYPSRPGSFPALVRERAG